MALVKAETENGHGGHFASLVAQQRATKKPRQSKCATVEEWGDAGKSAPEEVTNVIPLRAAAPEEAQTDPACATAPEPERAATTTEPTQEEAPAAEPLAPWWAYSDEAIAEAMAAHMDVKRIARISALACDLIQKRRFQKAA
jgi:hypothetical protein